LRQSLGAYELKRLLGRGGMGAVYLAHDSRLSRDVALKLLSPQLVTTPGFRERFLAEARSCSRLNHPGITTIHEIGTEDGVDYIAFEYVDGENLEALLEREGRLSTDRALGLSIQLASALVHAHERGVVHRDLKPANVVVSTIGIPKILDFGLAKAVPLEVSSEGDTLARLTQAGTILGTIAYMAPEQALGETVDERCDVFSFGCLLYEMLAGSPAFGGATPTRVLDRLLHEEPEPLDRVRNDVSSELAQLVAKAMRKKASERFQSVRELEEALRGLDRARSPSSVRSTARAVTLVAAVLLLALSSFVLLRDRVRPPVPNADAVAVMYFENVSDPEDSDRTGRMLAELLTGELASEPEINVLSRQRLHDVFRGLELGETSVDPSVATEVAKAASVSTMVLGQVTRVGPRLVASVELVDVASGRSIASDRAQASSSEDVFALAESLGESTRERLRRLRGIDGGAAPPGSWHEPTTSLEAYRHYVSGEAALYASDLETAVEELQEAVRLDPEFSLASFRLSLAARWSSDGPVAHQAARRALASVEGAPGYLRDVIRANAAYQEGAYSQAIPLLIGALERDPEQKEALYLLGQIYVHSLRDGDPGRAIELMERLLALDSGFHQVYDRLALSYAFQGNFERARELLAAWEPIRPDKVEGLRSILATFEGQPEEALAFGQNFSWIEGPLFQATAAMMAARWEVARGLVEQESEEWRSDALRAWALRNRAVFHTYVGEFDRAVESYRRAGASSGLRTDEGSGGGVPASALQLLAELQVLAGDVGAARIETERALEIQPESFRGLYYAGRMALLDSDVEEAEGHLVTLRRIAAGGASAAATVYLRALEGELALSRGELARAEESFESALQSSLMLDWASTCSSAGASIRDGMARTYLALGRDADATRTLEALVTSGAERVDHPVLFTQSLYRLGLLKLESGQEEEGRRLLTRYLSQWGEADWEIGSVADARERLRALSPP
jgi:serine/threonine protein kinase/tetratricopeptide (TPR) repeat protein